MCWGVCPRLGAAVTPPSKQNWDGSKDPIWQQRKKKKKQKHGSMERRQKRERKAGSPPPSPALPQKLQTGLKALTQRAQELVILGITSGCSLAARAK